MQQFIVSRRFQIPSYFTKIEYSQVALERKKKLDLYDKLEVEGCSQETSLEAIKCSRATLFRHKKRYKTTGLYGLEKKNRRPSNVKMPQWSLELENLVCKVRNENYFFGKLRLADVLKQKYKVIVSESTIGRILVKLLKQGRIRPVSYYTSTHIPKKRIFTTHAQRITPGAKSKQPGELIQIDHTTVQLDSGKTIKQFSAICPFTRILVCKAYQQATSLNATDFLDFVRQQLSFPIISIQVDGGSEFMSHFEKACETHLIPLFVLPPRSPKINGSVERSNRTVKEEFYSQYNSGYNLKIINYHLQNWLFYYNNRRPHTSLQCSPPLEYYLVWRSKK